MGTIVDVPGPQTRDLVAQTPLSPRTELPYRAAALVGLINHVGLLALFAGFGVWPMALFNLLSIAAFAVALRLVGQGRVGVGMVLALGEVIIHQIFAVHFTGLEPGFQLYLPVVGALPLMLPRVSTGRRIAYASVPVLAFLVLTYVYESPAPTPFPDAVAAGLGQLNLFIAFSAPWIFVYYFRHGAELAEDGLARAVQRSENLLYGILPPAIVARLREGEVIADSFDDVSILFCDIVGFTALAQRKSPEALVRMLDEVFAGFDDLVESAGLEKIKTIGDAYMVAAGVPEPLEAHACRLAQLALDIRASAQRYADSSGEPLSLRLGMHCGAAVAGVIGKSKFAYDLWGDAVNTAARMESHGEPGRIHVSDQMAEALREQFVLRPRGALEIKGMGEMHTHWLECAREPSPQGAGQG